MRILIIFPSSGIESEQAVGSRKEPLGACYLSAFLKLHGLQTKVIDQYIQSDKSLLEEIHVFKPDIIGFSTMTYNYPKALAISKLAKEKNNRIVTVFGGPHASGMPEIVREKEVDFAVIGEGEETFLELINFIRKQRIDYEKINGISFLKDGKVIITPARKRIKNLDDLPFPDRSDLPMDKYTGYGLKYIFKKRLGTIHSSRGCRGKCTFCSTPVTWKGGWFSRSAKSIVDEMEHLRDFYNVDIIFFADEDFFFNKKRVLDICREIRHRNVSINWSCFSKISDIDFELLCIIKAAGCISLVIGVESMNDNSLSQIDKRITRDKIKKAIQCVNKTGLIVEVTYMIGYPWESLSEMYKGLRLLKRNKIDYVYLNYVIPFPGTPFFNYCYENKLILTDDFNKYCCTRPIIKTEFPTSLDYFTLRKKLENNFNNGFLYTRKIRYLLKQIGLH